MKCPSCKDQVLIITERKDIEIDYCPECRGVWLDRGELDKIIEKSAVATESQRDSYKNPEKYDRKHHHYRQKSFLSELFD